MGGIKIVSASAGSGKTYRLAYEYVRNVMADPALYRNILAVTFTNKATEEMKQRIIGEINSLANASGSTYLPALVSDLGMSVDAVKARAVDVRTRILHDYSHFTILTIDKFFQRIIRSFIKELGIDLDFNLELQTDPILSTAADRLIDEITLDGRLRAWMVRFIEEKIDENKRWDIRSELTGLGQELFKERYRNVADGNVTKEELARIVGEAAAESKAATDKMKDVALKALGVIERGGLGPEDFSGGKGSFAGYFVKTRNGVFEKPGKRVEDALESDEKWYAKTSPHKEDIRAVIPSLRPLLQELYDTFYTTQKQRNTAQLLRENYRSFALLADLRTRIADICAEQNIMPISETNAVLNKLVSGNDSPFIFEKVGNSFSHYMIDEFQDTSAQQWENFIPLLHNSTAQSEDDPVLLVGDVKQSIYRWRGGDWRILESGVKSEFGGAAVKNLDTNYRSAKQIVDFNNRTIDNIVKSDDRYLNDLINDAKEGGIISAECRDELSGILVRAYEGHTQKPSHTQNRGFVRITEYPANEDGGKSLVIAAIEELQDRGYSPSDTAILVRYKNDGVRIANELLDYKTANPKTPYRYDIVTQEALTISNSEAVGFMIAVMSLAANRQDTVKRAVYNKYLGRGFDAPTGEEESGFIGSLRLMPLGEAFEEILLHYSLNGKTNEIAYIQALQEQLLSFGSSRISDIPLFLKWWEETGKQESVKLPDNPDAITITTIHKAKGLEYKAVIIPCCDWPLDPKSNSVMWAQSSSAPYSLLAKVPVKYKGIMGESHFAEDFYREKVLSHIDNINTYYVASTRAEEELHILIPQKKSHEGLIGGLILESAENGMQDGCKKKTEDGAAVYEFGIPSRYDKPVPSKAPVPEYPSRKIGAALRFKLDSDRYFKDEDAAVIALSPRNYGILMHRVFENINGADEIEAQIKTMRANGVISDAEEKTVKATIEKALANPVIKSWFDEKWDTVRNENDIITPSSGGVYKIRRPDRVITKGTQATVVDYKFGRQKKTFHARQISEYMELLAGMGYKNIRGYIWYVELDEITEVTADPEKAL